jgi:hypothetical protein
MTPDDLSILFGEKVIIALKKQRKAEAEADSQPDA